MPSWPARPLQSRAGVLKNVSPGMEDGDVCRTIGEEALRARGRKTGKTDTRNDWKCDQEGESVGSPSLVFEMGKMYVQREKRGRWRPRSCWAPAGWCCHFPKLGITEGSLTSSSSGPQSCPGPLSTYRSPKCSVSWGQIHSDAYFFCLCLLPSHHLLCPLLS